MQFLEEKLLPCRPYLFRAFYDWIVDNQLTPLIVVDTNVDHVQVPLSHIKQDQIVLNIAFHSVDNYRLDKHCVEFNARFNGQVEHIYVPMAAIKAIYARENGMGMAFAAECQYESDSNQESKQTKSKPIPLFSLVRND